MNINRDELGGIKMEMETVELNLMSKMQVHPRDQSRVLIGNLGGDVRWKGFRETQERILEEV